MRGEQDSFAVFLARCVGSPPLARGTATKRFKCFVTPGITPACAGNSVRTSLRRKSTEDHPRLRGEQFVFWLGRRRCLGSPPLARGTEYCTPVNVSTYRITPACAGNSVLGVVGACKLKDHPRLRGEQTKKRLVVSCILQYRFSFFNQFFVDMFC